MQRLMVFLGHPVYGLGVVLFTILLFSGIGSTTVGARAPAPGHDDRRASARCWRRWSLAGLLTPLVTDLGARREATDMRIVVSVLLLAPPAFCMGMMFPLGPQHLAPPRGAAAVLLERQRHHLDAGVGAGHGAVDRIRHRQDLRARRRLLRRLRRDAGLEAGGERTRCRGSKRSKDRHWCLTMPLRRLQRPSGRRRPCWSASRRTDSPAARAGRQPIARRARSGARPRLTGTGYKGRRPAIAAP